LSTATATVVSVNVGMPEQRGQEGDPDVLRRPWFSSIFKSPIDHPVRLGLINLEGDSQGDRKVHGGVDRSVNVYPAEHYPYWRSELGLPDLAYSVFGENFTTIGQTENSVCIGDIYTVGEAVVQVTQPRLPCWKLARRFHIKDLAVRWRVTGRVGWHLRTLQEGAVSPNQEMVLEERPHPEWTIERAFAVIVNSKKDRASALSLAACPALSDYQRRALGDPSSVADRVEVESAALVSDSGVPPTSD